MSQAASGSFSRQKHEVSAQAAVEAGSIVARQHVDVTWAVPLTGNQRRKLGRFWNYFPTQHETSLRGIVNAAFKMNEDRHSILETPVQRGNSHPDASPHGCRRPERHSVRLTIPALFLDILPSRQGIGFLGRRRYQQTDL